ncbi:6358_t:CDS:2 [Cetraspora pellucida]|uniref:6358_t:CDS:1 n=1 Tax=Cetraspora pellucida TaxID=1433469 RepID=A0A9N8VSY5_9GLOM|nr:6358_t:CDS:2 [Cetraspora pellucida]
MRISTINDWFKVAFQQAYIKFFDYDSFDTIKIIGKGGFGTIFSAYSSDTEKIVALKSLYAEGSIDEGFVGEREIPIEETPIDFMNLYCDAWNVDPSQRPTISEIRNRSC